MIGVFSEGENQQVEGLWRTRWNVLLGRDEKRS